MTWVTVKTVGYVPTLYQCFLGVMLVYDAVSGKGSDSPLLPLLQMLVSEKSHIKLDNRQ